MKKTIKPYRPIYPSPAALISSIDGKGNGDIVALGGVFNISTREPITIGIAIQQATYSHGLISETKEFTINLPTAQIFEKVDRCSTVSGRGNPNKFLEVGLTPFPSTKVRPPCISECPVNVECEVIDIMRVGDHSLFIGKVVAMHVDSDKLDERDRIVINRSLDPLVYLLGEYWSIGDRLGTLSCMVRQA